MSGIKKFNVLWEKEAPEGEWGDYVKTVDHEAEITRLRAEVEENEKVINVWRGRTQRAEADVEAYRKDAERYRFIRNERNHALTKWRGASLDGLIDAAMGASA